MIYFRERPVTVSRVSRPVSIEVEVFLIYYSPCLSFLAFIHWHDTVRKILDSYNSYHLRVNVVISLFWAYFTDSPVTS